MLHSYFPSWECISTQREVVFFVCGLMSEPTYLVDHVYQMWNKISNLRIRKYYKPRIDEEMFKSLYAESTMPLPGRWNHNQYFNYYNHEDDDRKERPRDTFPVFLPSNIYIFERIKTDIVNDPKEKKKEAGKKMSECFLIVQKPKVTATLWSTCQEIGQQQAITNMWMEQLKYCNNEEAKPLKISQYSKSIILTECSLPLSVLDDLMQQISDSGSLCLIDLHKTSLKNIPTLLLLNKLSLLYLDLSGTNMSPKLCNSVCQQIKNLVLLEYLDLSTNNLAYVQEMRFPPEMPLKFLNLCKTKMHPELLNKVVEEVNSLCQLEDTDLSGNRMTGVLSCFLPDEHPGLPELRRLNLQYTSLNKMDIKHLAYIIQKQKVPALQVLDLTRDHRFEEEIERLIEVCRTQQIMTLPKGLFFSEDDEVMIVDDEDIGNEGHQDDLTIDEINWMFEDAVTISDERNRNKIGDVENELTIDEINWLIAESLDKGN